MNSLSIRTKLVILFAALVTIPLVTAIAWLGITAHSSVLDAGHALTGVADATVRQSAGDVARLTALNAQRSSDELVRIGRGSLVRFAEREIRASEQTLRQSTDHLTRTGSAAMQRATVRIAAASAGAVSDANSRLRRHQRQAIGGMGNALIGSSRRAFDRLGGDLLAESEEMIVHLALDLNLERSRRTAERVASFLQGSIDAVSQAAQEPRLLGGDMRVANRLRQLLDQHRVAFLRVELLSDSGEVIAQYPPPLPASDEGRDAGVDGRGTAPRLGEGPSPMPALPPVAAAALANDQAALSPVQFGPQGAPPVVAVAAAVRGARGQGLGPAPVGRRVLVATLSLEVLSHLLLRQSLGGGQPAPVFVMTPEGQVLAHSEPGNIGNFLSLPSRGGTQRVEGDSVVFESPGGGRERLLIASTKVWRTNWAVVAVQPLTHLMAQMDELRRVIRATAETAANEMAREAGAHAARLEAAAVQEQRRVAEETAARVRRENQEVARNAVAVLVRQQNAMAQRTVERMKRDSRAASQAAAVTMVGRADQIAAHSGARIRGEAARRARLSLASMHALAGQTADAAAGRIIFQSGGVLAVALLAALLVALVTAQSAVRPITALASGAQSIARGDFSHRVRIGTEDELGQLAGSFNQMAASIEMSRAELQASNAILAQEKRRIQTIVDNSPDGLLILNENGSVGYANPAARSFLPWRASVPAGGQDGGDDGATGTGSGATDGVGDKTSDLAPSPRRPVAPSPRRPVAPSRSFP